MKIMIFANDTLYTYTTRNEMIERFVADGHEVVVVAQPLLLQEELQKLGCRLIEIKVDRRGTNPLSDLKLLMNFKNILLKEKPDVALTFNIKQNVYAGLACRITKTRYMPNITGLGTPLEHPGLMQKISTRLYKAGVVGADCVFFQNSENQNFFESRNMLRKGARTRLLPGSGVSLKMHKAMPYPEDNTQINFLFVARMMKDKGADLYLDAAQNICEKHKNVVFHICGRCDDSRYIGLLKTAEKKGYVAWHGEQKDLVPFYEMAHCVVLPSYHEGMSNVLLEAAAHCRPIITSDRAGCRETVNNEKSGFIISLEEKNSLETAVERFLAMSFEQRRDMGLAGRAKIEKEFDRQIVVNTYVEEIKRGEK